MRSFYPFAAALALLARAGLAAAAAEPSITPLDFEPAAVSADGGVVVGTKPGLWKAVRWTPGGGTSVLEMLPGYGHRSFGAGVSGDGSVVAGVSFNSSGLSQAFRWTADGGTVGLGHLPGHDQSFASGVSADGSVVVGASRHVALGPTENSEQQGFRWTANGGMVGWGHIGYSGREGVSAVSADGSVVVGGKSVPPGPSEAFRWTAGGGVIGLGLLPGHVNREEGLDGYSEARGVSADGRVVVGRSTVHGTVFDEEQPHAFRWTADEGMVGLGALAGDQFSYASAVSADGSVVVGTSLRLYYDPFDLPAYSETAFIWDRANGMRSLQDVLGNLGLDLTGLYLNNATAISADGLTVTGTGLSRSGSLPGWTATIPEPATLPLLGLACLLLGQRRRSAQDMRPRPRRSRSGMPASLSTFDGTDLSRGRHLSATA